MSDPLQTKNPIHKKNFDHNPREAIYQLGTKLGPNWPFWQFCADFQYKIYKLLCAKSKKANFRWKLSKRCLPEHPEIMTNRNTFNKKVRNQMQDVDKDGLSSTRFRIVNRQDYQGKHEIIEVVI